MDALAVGLAVLLLLLLVHQARLSHQLRAWRLESTTSREPIQHEIELDQLAKRLDRALDLFSAKPALQGRLGEETVELALGQLPRRYWQRQATVANGNRPDYLLTLGPDLKVAVDAKMVGAGNWIEGEKLEPAEMETRMNTLARDLASRYLEAGNRIALVLMVIPTGLHGNVTAATLQACHSRGVIPTPAEGVTALALMLLHLQPWLTQGAETELARDLSATRRALATSVELLERSSRQQRNGQENLERARQLLEGARTRLEANRAGRVMGGHTPSLEEALER